MVHLMLFRSTSRHGFFKRQRGQGQQEERAQNRCEEYWTILYEQISIGATIHSPIIRLGKIPKTSRQPMQISYPRSVSPHACHHDNVIPYI